MYRTVEYTADSESGFQARIKTNEPSLSDYYLDNRSQTTFPADVVLEVAESPRGLQYSSSDQISNNHYSNENNNYQTSGYPKNKPFQFNEPDHQYASSNNYDNHFGKSLAYDQMNKNKDTNNKNFIKWNHQNKNTDYQSAYTDLHPIFVDSNNLQKSKKQNNRFANTFLSNRFSNTLPEVDDTNILVVKNQKFSNKTKDKSLDQQPKLLLTSLQLEKPIQQFKSLQYYKPTKAGDIRQKFLNNHPRRFRSRSQFASDFY